MPTATYRPQPITAQPDSVFPTETNVTAIIARRARLTIAHASVVVRLAGLGPREVR